MNWPIRVDDEIDYLLQIERREGSHTLSSLFCVELYILTEYSIAHATPEQSSALTTLTVEIHENDLVTMGVRCHLYEWDLADRRLMRIICAAILAGYPADIEGLKRKYNLPDRHGTWDDRHWDIVFRALLHDH